MCKSDKGQKEKNRWEKYKKSVGVEINFKTLFNET